MSFFLVPNLVREYIDRIFYLLQRKRPQPYFPDAQSFYESLPAEKKDDLVQLVHMYRLGGPGQFPPEIVAGTVFDGVTFTFDELRRVPFSSARERRALQEESDRQLAASLQTDEERSLQEERDREYAISLQESEDCGHSSTVPRLSESERRRLQEQRDLEYAISLQESEDCENYAAVPRLSESERRRLQEQRDREYALSLQESEDCEHHPAVPRLSESERRRLQEQRDLEYALSLQESEDSEPQRRPAVPRLSESERRRLQEQRDLEYALSLQESEENGHRPAARSISDSERRRLQEEQDRQFALSLQEQESNQSSRPRRAASERRPVSSSRRGLGSASRRGPLPDVEHMTYEQRLEVLEDVHVGLSEEQIARYPVTPFHKTSSPDAETRCSICLCDFEEQEGVLILQCLHHFHPECVIEWLKKSTKCPVCQLDLRSADGSH